MVTSVTYRLFWRIQQLELDTYGIMFGVVTIVSTFLMSLAYKNVKYSLKHKIAQRRHAGVTAEVMQQVRE